MKVTNCGSCKSLEINQFLDLGKTPLADKLPATAHEEEDWYPLGAAVCGRCSLVQLTEMVPDEDLYQNDYAFYTGANKPQVKYWRDYADQMRLMFPEAWSCLEIASNDGTLLAMMASRNFKTVGVDPSVGPGAAAAEKGLETYLMSFGIEAAGKIGSVHKPFDLILANNVLAHVSDLDDFLKGIEMLMHRKSVVVFEVQYLGDLVLGNFFDLFYHQHRYFFSLRTLTRLLMARGFSIFDWEHVPVQGGSIRIYADLGYREVSPDVKIQFEREVWLDEWFLYDSFQDRVEAIRNQLTDMVADELLGGRQVIGWAAPAKATTLLNYCGLDKSKISWIEDSTEYKWNRFFTGTGIPVRKPNPTTGYAPEETTVMLLAHNYLSVMIRTHPDFMAMGGRIIIPLPKPVLL